MTNFKEPVDEDINLPKPKYCLELWFNGLPSNAGFFMADFIIAESDKTTVNSDPLKKLIMGPYWLAQLVKVSQGALVLIALAPIIGHPNGPGGKRPLNLSIDLEI